MTSIDPSTEADALERAAGAISSYIVLVAIRAADGPRGTLPQEESAAFRAMRDALGDAISSAYDRGYRKAYEGINRKRSDTAATDCNTPIQCAATGCAGFCHLAPQLRSDPQ